MESKVFRFIRPIVDLCQRLSKREDVICSSRCSSCIEATHVEFTAMASCRLIFDLVTYNA